MAAFASASDLISRFDSRTLGDLCSDDGDRVEEHLLSADTKITAALDDASGQVKAAVLRGKRYTASDLSGLTDESLAYLKRITCVIAFWNLWDRKPYTDDEQYTEARKNAQELLALLASGEHIFEVSATIAAGIPKVDTVTRQELVNEWELVTDRARGRFYPRRRTYRDR